ncbi:hypothetical protein ACNTMW_20115 [Planosporangium sp. 12N6]
MLVIVIVLCFAIAYPVVTDWSGVSTSVVEMTLAAIPGILLAAYGRRHRR